MTSILVVAFAIALPVILYACSSPGASALTIGAMADAGREVYAKHCGGCHGGRGQGGTAPTLVGSHSHVHHFDAADELLTYISTTMPQNAPGSLSMREYQECLCYLLMENGLALRNMVFDQKELQHIKLESGASHSD